MSNQAAVLKEAKARLILEERSIPQPEQDEVLVKNVALATNPADWKMQESGFFIDSYPIILGSDVAGSIEEVGSNVTRFKKGDRVAGFADVLISKKPEHAAFQQYTILAECATTKLPNSVSFEAGSVLPMSIATAGIGIFQSLKIPRPPAKQHGGFLVWGASSSVGTAAVQIAASLGYTVYAVCSACHSAYIKKLGAYETFDYNDSLVTVNITQYAKVANQQIILGFDAISEHGSAPQCAEIIGSFGGGKLFLTCPYPEDAKKPEGVEISYDYAAKIVVEKDFGRWLFSDWLERSLVDGTYIPSPVIEKVDGGVGAVQNALDIHKKGLSGKKLVLTV